jgi:hypothetical protein
VALVVVGGQSRHVGKTSVVAGLISAMPERGWTAAKITQDPHGAFAVADADVSASILIHEERDRAGESDSSRYLAAGAQSAFWVRIRHDRIAQAMPSLLQHLKMPENLILESNRALEFLNPQVSLMVVDYGSLEVKPSAQDLLHRVHAIVKREAARETGLPPPPWIAKNLRGRPIFSMQPPRYVNDELVDFVRQRLNHAAR